MRKKIEIIKFNNQIRNNLIKKIILTLLQQEYKWKKTNTL